MEKLEKLLRFIVEELVETKEEIQITYEVIDENINFKISVAKGEMGRLIGKNGIVANSIRGLMQASGVKDKVFVNVEFVD